MSRFAATRIAVASVLYFCVHTAMAFDAFVPTGSLVNPRYGANAELLVNGNVLVAGGRGLLGAEATAEIYDVAANRFSVTGPMVGAFVYRASARLANGDVLFVGGLADSDSDQFGTNHAEIFRAAANTFVATGSLVAYGNYPGTRWAATATPLLDGRVLVVGGLSHNGKLSDAQLYDPASGTFSLTGFMSTARAGHTATRLLSGRVLVTGGTQFGNSDFHNQSAEIWDPASATFVSTGEMISYINGRYGATATLLDDGSVLIAGGEDGVGNLLTGAERFDEASGTFISVGDLATARLSAGAALLADGHVLLAGGVDSTDTATATAELFDPAAGKFSSAANLSSARGDAAVVGLRGGRALYAGGSDADGAPLVSVEIYVANVIFHGTFDSP